MDVLNGTVSLIAVLTSGVALWYAKRADTRAADADKRDAVRFEAMFMEEWTDEYVFRLINRGTKTAKWPRIDAESVSRFAVGQTVWMHAAPGDPLTFRYEKPRVGKLESMRITWKGAGTGEQVITIPAHPEKAPAP